MGLKKSQVFMGTMHFKKPSLHHVQKTLLKQYENQTNKHSNLIKLNTYIGACDNQPYIMVNAEQGKALS